MVAGGLLLASNPCLRRFSGGFYLLQFLTAPWASANRVPFG
jgi:hypothetical protein